MIKTFDLYKHADFREFHLWKTSVLDLLKDAYGDTYFGDQIYNAKFNRRNLKILIAFHNDQIPIGVLIKKDSGKVSALAIARRYWGNGVASELVNKIRQEDQYIFGEVSASNVVMHSLLRKLNCHAIKDKNKILGLLENEEEKVSFLKNAKSNIIYYHASKNGVNADRSFILYEIAENSPPTVSTKQSLSKPGYRPNAI
jgi:hypothetical protein